MMEFLVKWVPLIALASLVVAIGTLIGMWSIYRMGERETERRRQEDKANVKQAISEELKLANIPSPSERIITGIEEGEEKKLSDSDKKVVASVAQKLDEADKRFKELVGDPSDYMKLGYAEYNKGNYEKAIEQYDKAIELKPDYADAWYSKGHALRKLGRHEEALKSFDKAIELKQDYVLARYGKSLTLRKLGRFEEARKANEKAEELRSQK